MTTNETELEYRRRSRTDADGVAPYLNTTVTVTGGVGPYIEIRTITSKGESVQGSQLSPQDAIRIGQALIDAGHDWQSSSPCIHLKR